MIIYNVTVKVDPSIAASWLDWLQHEHIPDIIGTGCFSKAVIVKILEVDETDGPTYAIQYFAESKAMYDQYIEQYAGIMRQKGFDKWGNKFMAFRSVMEVVN